MTEIKKSGRMRGLDRAFAILDFLRISKRPLRPNEIAVSLGAPKSSIYEIISILIENNILEQSHGDGRVYLGRRLYFWGTAYAANFDLTREAQPYLEKITGDTRETSQLCMLEGDKYTVVIMKEGSRPFRISSDVGEPIPIPWTASGRLLTAHMSDEEIRSFIPENDFNLPNGSHLKPSDFIAEVRKAYQEGFFSFDSIADNFTHCFAAPVFNEEDICIATLCLIAPKEDASRNYAQYRRILINSAHEITTKLSGSTFERSGAAHN